jgi:hypothetical protein
MNSTHAQSKSSPGPHRWRPTFWLTVAKRFAAFSSSTGCGRLAQGRAGPCLAGGLFQSRAAPAPLITYQRAIPARGQAQPVRTQLQMQAARSASTPAAAPNLCESAASRSGVLPPLISPGLQLRAGGAPLLGWWLAGSGVDHAADLEACGGVQCRVPVGLYQVRLVADLRGASEGGREAGRQGRQPSAQQPSRQRWRRRRGAPSRAPSGAAARPPAGLQAAAAQAPRAQRAAGRPQQPASRRMHASMPAPHHDVADAALGVGGHVAKLPGALVRVLHSLRVCPGVQVRVADCLHDLVAQDGGGAVGLGVVVRRGGVAVAGEGGAGVPAPA